MNTGLMFSRATDEWQTPSLFIAEMDREFAFELDAAATLDNRVCGLYFGPDHQTPGMRDALACDWRWELERVFSSGTPAVWLNPPYSKCRAFIAKAAAEAAKGCTVVCLVPSRTDTRWWHDYVWNAEQHRARPGVEIRFLKGRLKFGGATAGAPFPSVVIIFRAPQRTA